MSSISDLPPMPKKTGGGISDLPPMPKKEPEGDAGAALMGGAKQGLLFGYAPQVEAGLERGTDKLMALFGAGPEAADEKLRDQGFKVPKRDYLTARDEAVDKYERLQKENPGTYAVGQIGGGLLTLPALSAVPGLAATEGAGLIKSGAQAVGSGALVGALQNPGDQKGVIDPLQLEERKEGAKQGAKFGAIAFAAGEGIKKAAQKITEVAPSLKEFSDMLALKSSGAMLKDYRKLNDRGRVEEIADTLFKEGLIQPGSTVDDIAKGSRALKQSVGSEIGKVYDVIGDTASVALNPNELSKDLKQAVLAKAPKVGGKAYTEFSDGIIQDIVGNPENLTDVRRLNDIIGELDQRINYQKAIKDLPEKQEALFAIRQTLRKGVNDIVDSFGKISDAPELGKAMKALNKRYSNLSEIHSIATDQSLRQNANRFLSLTDTIAGVGGGGIASTLTSSDDPDKRFKTLLGGAAFALGNKAMRKFGPQVGAKATRLGSQVMSPVSQTAGVLNQGLQSLSPTALGLIGAQQARKREIKK